MKTILVTGSKGYIGSHVVKQLLSKGYKVIGFDDLHNSKINNTNDKEIFYNGDIRDKQILSKIMAENKIDLIMHFAGLIAVHESVLKPELYFDVNFNGTKNLIETAKEYSISNFIFSSTAATYGNPKKIPITEDDEQNPINPYGESKLAAERFLINSGIKFTIFRYFNVAGSGGDGLGYFPKQEATHLIPLINKVATNPDELSFKIFGNNYNTEDGTCIRDYIHVVDLAEAHILAAENMLYNNESNSEIYNLSSGKGYSVKEVYQAANKVHGFKLPLEIVERRSGDPDILIASSKKIENDLNWNPKLDIKDMIKSDFNK